MVGFAVLEGVLEPIPWNAEARHCSRPWRPCLRSKCPALSFIIPHATVESRRARKQDLPRASLLCYHPGQKGEPHWLTRCGVVCRRASGLHSSALTVSIRHPRAPSDPSQNPGTFFPTSLPLSPAMSLAPTECGKAWCGAGAERSLFVLCDIMQ